MQDISEASSTMHSIQSSNRKRATPLYSTQLILLLSLVATISLTMGNY